MQKHQGRITHWKDEQGFGFIIPDEGGAEVFVHIKSFVIRHRRPVDGEVVTFELGTDPEGRLRALRVLIDGQRMPRKSRKSLVKLRHINFIIVAAFSLFLVETTGTGHLSVLIVGLYLIMSLVSFVAYTIDKSAAKRGKWRTQETTLHALDLLCGWPGGLIAQTVLRHKTSKLSFLITTWLMVILNCGALLYAGPLLSRVSITLPDIPQQFEFHLDDFFQDEDLFQDEDSNMEDPNHGIKITPR